MAFGMVDKETLLKNEKNELYLSIIVQELENILDAHLIQDERVYDKIEKLIFVCQKKLGIELNWALLCANDFNFHKKFEFIDFD